ncbi:MAG: leucine-rich repeat protein [Paludibacteraceae bacterium]|nr:leucine-rich repeat protein [Paludibacteraceae bacterium]
MKKLTLFLIGLLSIVCVQAEKFEVNGIYYNTIDGQCVEVTHNNVMLGSNPPTFVNYEGLTTANLPSEVTYNGVKYNVVSIGNYAFNGCKTLTSILIPNSVTSVGEGAFQNCSSLTSLTLPDGVLSINDWTFSGCTQLTSIQCGENITNIGKYAFENCSNLSTFVIPNKVQKIGDYAFAKCTSLTSLVIPENVAKIGWGIVSYCDALASIVVAEQNPTFDSRDNCNSIIETATNTIVTTCTQSVIPNSVTNIGACAFYGRTDLTHIIIPEHITSINDYAFANCTSLESVSIGDNFKSIGKYAFRSCKTMTSFSIGKGIESIMQSAFMDCGKLETFICNAVTPPATQWSTFEVSPTAVLYVPTESVDLYKNDNEWKDFYKILPLNYSYKSQWCDTWNILYFSKNDTTPKAQTWQYTLGKDTIIEGKTYTAVNRHWTIDPENTEEYVASVRFTNNDKVYVYYDNTEYLLYDFSVQEDDSVEVFAGINAYEYAKTYKGRVYDISYTEKGAKICKISVPDSTYENDYGYGGTYYSVTWIEGIGNAHMGLLMGNATDTENEYIYNLQCAYKGDELMHETDHYLFDIYGCEYNSETYEPRFFETLQRTEVSEHTTGGDTTYLVTYDRFVGRIINNNLYWYDYANGNFFRETKDQIILSFPFGGGEECVLYDFSLEVGDTLPVMKYDEKTRGEMFRVVDLSMVTLLDGKEYKKWTLACGYEYIEKIGAINGKGLGNYIALGENTDLATYIGAPLVCASRNGKILYLMDDAEMERLGTKCLCDVDINDNAKDKDLGGRPTPTQWFMLEEYYRERQNLKTQQSVAPAENAETFVYELLRDTTIINGKKYLPLICYSTVEDDTTTIEVGALHFNNNRVYFFYDNAEHLLYDFNASVGDTLTIFAGINNYPQDVTYPHVVTYKHVSADGSAIITLNAIQQTYENGKLVEKQYEKVWISGLGSIDGIVHNSMQEISNKRITMLCAWLEDECIYSTYLPTYNTLGCVYNSNTTTAIEDIQPVTPSYQKLLRDGQLLIIHEGKTYNVMGVVIE